MYQLFIAAIVAAISLLVPAQAQVRASVAPAVMAECAAQQTLTPFCQAILQQMQGDPSIASERFAIIPGGRYQPPIVVGGNTRYGSEQTYSVVNNGGYVRTVDASTSRTPYTGAAGQVGYAPQGYGYPQPPYYGGYPEQRGPYYGQQQPRGGGGLLGALDRTLNGVNSTLGQYERAAGTVARAGHRIEAWEANQEATRQRRARTARDYERVRLEKARRCAQYPDSEGC